MVRCSQRPETGDSICPPVCPRLVRAGFESESRRQLLGVGTDEAVSSGRSAVWESPRWLEPGRDHGPEL